MASKALAREEQKGRIQVANALVRGGLRGRLKDLVDCSTPEPRSAYDEAAERRKVAEALRRLLDGGFSNAFSKGEGIKVGIPWPEESQWKVDVLCGTPEQRTRALEELKKRGIFYSSVKGEFYKPGRRTKKRKPGFFTVKKR